jgi:transposase InsO family protein
MQIYPGSPWENGYNERFNGTLRKEVLNAEWFHTTPHDKSRSLSMLGSGNTTRSDLITH